MRMGRVVNVIVLLGVAIDRPVVHQRTSLPNEAGPETEPAGPSCERECRFRVIHRLLPIPRRQPE